jgi:cellulose synthase/poly-beta-1,6-N-acetylglucosamine synthase-like glycosyltransferase
MTAMFVACACLAAVILTLHIALCVGCAVNFLRQRGLEAVRGAVTVLRPEVIVAVRDEEATLPGLLDALRGQTAPGCSFLLIDDRSTDGTAGILDGFCAEMGSRARVIHNAAEPHELTGKQSALDLAFTQARGDVLLFTDGDCSLPPTWVEEMLRPFHDSAVGVVLGRIELAEEKGFLRAFQAFEQPLINQYNLGSVGLGMATGGFGNNMAVRAAAVREVGGFATLGFSLTEDALLLDAISRTGRWQARVCTSAEGAATTHAMPSWAAYVEQHTRWNAGALFAKDPVTRLFYVFIVLIYLVGSFLAAPLAIVDWRFILLAANAYLSMGLLGIVSGLYPGKARGRYFLRFLPYLLFFGPFYSFITLRALLRRSVAWKGATLKA